MNLNDITNIFFIILAFTAGFVLGDTSFDDEINSTNQVNIKHTKTVITRKDTIYVYSIPDIKKQLKQTK